MDSDSNFGYLIFVALVFAVYGGLLISGSCDIKTEEMNRLMQQEGISQVALGGHAYFACGEYDVFSRKFSGMKNGQSVKGEVCAGWTKGYTIRYE